MNGYRIFISVVVHHLLEDGRRDDVNRCEEGFSQDIVIDIFQRTATKCTSTILTSLPSPRESINHMRPQGHVKELLNACRRMYV